MELADSKTLPRLDEHLGPVDDLANTEGSSPSETELGCRHRLSSGGPDARSSGIIESYQAFRPAIDSEPNCQGSSKRYFIVMIPLPSDSSLALYLGQIKTEISLPCTL